MPLTEIYLVAPSRLVVFVLVLTRISGLLMTAPFLSNRSAPLRVRAMLAVVLALFITPLQAQGAVPDPGTLINLVTLMIGEAIVGLSLGLGMLILFSGVQLTGYTLGQMSGAQLADAFDPTYDQSVPVHSQLLDLVTLAVFVTIGGHRELLDALLGTFKTLPLGGGGFEQSIAEAMLQVITESFTVGIRAAAPAIIALLASILILGLISRTLPQLNILAIGFSMNAFVMLAVVGMSLGGIVWVFQDQVSPTIDMLREAMHRSTSMVSTQ
jgi:flagellar biosynthetic protein FliR